MAWLVGEQLPRELEELFDGRELRSKVGKAILVAVVDQADFPHFAMISYGEVVAVDPRTLRLGLWEASSTTKRMRSTGKATLCLAEPTGVYYLKGTVKDLGQAPDVEPPIAKLEFRIEQVLQDGDPNGEVTSGITYRVTEPEDKMLERWERQVAALREG